jgi:hypothetical protein
MQKQVLRSFKFWNAVTIDGAHTTNTSTPTSIQFLDNIAIQITGTSTAVATITIEVSNDYDPNVPNSTGTWSTLTLSDTLNLTAGGTVFADLTQVPFPYIRTKFTRVSGGGTLTGYISAKGI